MAAVVAAGLLGVGLSTASAHTGDLNATGVCQDNGTRLVTYSGTTHSVPESGSGHTATLTVTGIVPSSSTVTPATQTVIGNTSFSFTQTIDGDVRSASATASLAWGDRASDAPTGRVTFTADCTPAVVVPPRPAPEVVVTHSATKDCAAKTVTTTTVTTTTGWVLTDNVWVNASPVSTQTATSRATTAQECPVAVPPVVVPPVTVAGVVAEAPAEATANPLPESAAAGEADTSGQLVAGGLTGLAAFLMLGAGFVLRRRHGEA